VEETSAEGAFRVTFPSLVRAPRGATSHFALVFHVAEGWPLQGPDGLRVEQTGGSEFTFEEIFLPSPALLPDPAGPGESGWTGTFEANLSFSFSSSEKASKAKYDAIVRVCYCACGEGSCRPDAVLELSIPVEVV
jgi:hypothetical protein